MNVAIPFLIAAAVPLMWIAILYFAAHIGGWAALAKRFPDVHAGGGYLGWE